MAPVTLETYFPLASAYQAATEKTQEYHEAGTETHESNSIRAFGLRPLSPLLCLPFELRQKIWEFVFQSEHAFPPQKTSNANRLCGLVVSPSPYFLQVKP
jgi:hypothetical protein